jgi:hypothetical protein
MYLQVMKYSGFVSQSVDESHMKWIVGTMAKVGVPDYVMYKVYYGLHVVSRV